jgi:hypothetical protein
MEPSNIERFKDIINNSVEDASFKQCLLTFVDKYSGEESDLEELILGISSFMYKVQENEIKAEGYDRIKAVRESTKADVEEIIQTALSIKDTQGRMIPVSDSE